MDKDTAMRLMEELDSHLAWSDEEYQKGIDEAEAEGEEPMANPHVFNVRLDASDERRDASRKYRVRVTFGEFATGLGPWRTLINAAEKADCSIYPQNSGIELS